MGLPVIEGKWCVDIGGSSFYLDDGEMSSLFAAYTDVAIARGRTPSLERQAVYAFLFPCTCIQVVDIVPACIVENVLFRVRDVMSKLPVSGDEFVNCQIM